MRRQQRVHVVCGRLVISSAACRTAEAHRTLCPLRCVSTENSATVGDFDRRDGADGGLVIQQQHLLEADVADFGCVAEDGARGGQRHLAVGGPGKGRHTVDLVIGQPRVRRGADLGLPHVALGLLLQTDVRAQQRMHGRAAEGPCACAVALRRQDQLDGGSRSAAGRPPGAQPGIEHREVHRGAGACRSPRRPRNPCGSGCSRRMPASAATGVSRLAAVCSTA